MKALHMRIVFFRRPRPKQFNYRPIYWDPEKEEMEERKKRLGLSGKDKTSEDIKDDLKYDIGRQWRRNREIKNHKAGTIKFLIYLFIILFFVYIIFFTDFIHNLLSFFVR